MQLDLRKSIRLIFNTIIFTILVYSNRNNIEILEYISLTFYTFVSISGILLLIQSYNLTDKKIEELKELITVWSIGDILFNSASLAFLYFADYYILSFLFLLSMIGVTKTNQIIYSKTKK